MRTRGSIGRQSFILSGAGKLAALEATRATAFSLNGDQPRTGTAAASRLELKPGGGVSEAGISQQVQTTCAARASALATSRSAWVKP